MIRVRVAGVFRSYEFIIHESPTPSQPPPNTQGKAKYLFDETIVYLGEVPLQRQWGLTHEAIRHASPRHAEPLRLKGGIGLDY